MVTYRPRQNERRCGRVTGATNQTRKLQSDKARLERTSMSHDVEKILVCGQQMFEAFTSELAQLAQRNGLCW